MSRLTACFSMYSLMSIRTMASSELKRNEASALANSVLPTPEGPRNMNDAMGRFGSDSPARLRWIAAETALTARSWPTTLLCSSSSRRNSFSLSLCCSWDTGMPVHFATTSATSASVTSSLSIFPRISISPSSSSSSSSVPSPPPPLPWSFSSPPPLAPLDARPSPAAFNFFWRAIRVPYLSSAALFKLYSRSACWISRFTLSISSLISRIRTISSFSRRHCAAMRV
mmetsp:Transcript_25212/g.45746  ORF Transcript_25212/g.45746 Transcript_25212/m.45746 type:complete len:227 (+) Transcript_25212:1146-1826(+)